MYLLCLYLLPNYFTYFTYLTYFAYFTIKTGSESPRSENTIDATQGQQETKNPSKRNQMTGKYHRLTQSTHLTLFYSTLLYSTALDSTLPYSTWYKKVVYPSTRTLLVLSSLNLQKHLSDLQKPRKIGGRSIDCCIMVWVNGMVWCRHHFH